MTAVQHQQYPFQPFEIALVRKLESKTTSTRDAFLLLDVDGDTIISPSDVRTVLHNELGIDITKEQEDILSSRIPNNKEGTIGLSYSEFAKYYQEVGASSYPTSQSGLAAVGFQTDTSTTGIDREKSIHLQPNQVTKQKRQQLRQLLTSHTSRESEHGVGSGVKETSLFLAMDVHKSGKVTMDELLHWLNTVGMLNWTKEDVNDVGFGSSSMTEHEFAEFVESLDRD